VKPTRQQILLGFMAMMVIFQLGDYVLNSMIQGPLENLRNEQGTLQEDIKKREKLLSEARVAGKKIELWKKKSLPTDIETARSLYRNWLLDVIRKAKLQNATVGSGSPANRYGLYRAMPFDLKARGTLLQLTNALFRFYNSDQLHEIKSLRITPVGNSGQFDISLGIEALIIPKSNRKSLSTGKAKLLVSSDPRDYAIIARDNIFGIGVNNQDPMKMTILSAVTSRNGKPLAWITELITGRVIKVAPQATFETVALSGRIVQIEQENAIIETGGQRMKLTIGQSFAQGTIIQPEATDKLQTQSDSKINN